MVASHHLGVTISGNGVTPHTLRLRDLIEVLSDLERALMATAGATKATADEFRVSLVGIETNRAELHFDANPKVRRAAALIARAIASRKSESLPQPATASIREIHARAVSRGWDIALSNGKFASVIRPAEPVFSDTLLSGGTTLIGTVMSVGGRRPTAKIDLEGRKAFTAEVDSQELAKRLGEVLYQRVTLEGDAWWYANSLELSRFKIRGLGTFDEPLSSAKDAFAAIRALSGDRWDSVDPDKFVRALRNETK